MLGFNKKAAYVEWRHPRFNRVVVLEIKTSPRSYAVATLDPGITTVRGEFDLHCVHAIDHATQEVSACRIHAVSTSKAAMLLVAERVDECFDTTRGGYRSEAQRLA